MAMLLAGQDHPARSHTERPDGDGRALFVNPLMAIYFTVDLDKLAARYLHLDRIENRVIAFSGCCWSRR
ncbi:hypothetical protein [Phytohabitans aurantiacus]|uniref:Uncharacterized protein n=1 Tax=Phytohabitans aurantiacus TaxID=3016789 RepID=A0ABQ5R6Q5_9ACTN|nr:hypothetical protein [Phytohabitans aurantiacus]GLI02449.1 hypothetical protein Pa4123_77270 [Phytohabitans aurantiacus]